MAHEPKFEIVDLCWIRRSTLHKCSSIEGHKAPLIGGIGKPTYLDFLRSSSGEMRGGTRFLRGRLEID